MALGKTSKTCDGRAKGRRVVSVMRLHALAALVFIALPMMSVRVAAADVDHSDSAKPLEPMRRTNKKSMAFAQQAPLFVEQKEAPTASKTALRMSTVPRLGEKSKD
jgi:hypothetical protein